MKLKLFIVGLFLVAPTWGRDILSKKHQTMIKLVDKTSDKIIRDLENQDIDRKDWKLSRITVGLLFVVEHKFTPLYKLEFETEVQLRFQPVKKSSI